MLFLIVNFGPDSGGDVDRARGMDRLIKSIEQAERCIADIIPEKRKAYKGRYQYDGHTSTVSF